MTTTTTSTPARAAAIGAFGFAAGVAVQNFVLLIGMPDASATMPEAAAWLADNPGRAATASALVGVNLPFLSFFTAALRSLTRDTQAARLWSDLGSLAVVVLASTFAVVAATQIASTLVAGAGATPIFTALWSLHNAAFAMSFSALAVTLLGFSIGAHAAGISPAWQRGVGLLAAVLLLVAGLANTAVAGGSPIVFVGLLGFALWLVWLVTTGVRLLR
ncbi:MAG: hypothetical protein EA416_16455 [Trueperaceae bacterium]|nr:MAG: hypothetical protein EA416_16455 [Trueperaceae bacterium]